MCHDCISIQDLLRRQDKALTKYTSSEADLPRTLQKKDDEIRALEVTLKKNKVNLKETADKNKHLEKKILRVQSQNDSLENIVSAKELKSRAALTKEVQDLRAALEARGILVTRLEHLVEVILRFFVQSNT